MSSHWTQFPELRIRYLVDLMLHCTESDHEKPIEAAVAAFAFATNKTVDWRHKDAPQLDRRTKA